jgi:glycosyltransferase involved in cell wall biosynthesis
MPNDTQAQLSQLEAERAAWERRARHAEASAAAQALRAHGLGWQAGVLRREVTAIRGSLFWRLTLPMRLAVVLLKGLPTTTDEGRLARHAWSVLRRRGLAAAITEGRAWRQRRRRAPRRLSPPAIAAPPEAAVSRARNVLIVAELSVPQCAKYRVWQKQAHFETLGVPCRVIDWHDTEAGFSAAATATQAILYRVPATPEILQLIEALRALGVPLAWEVDDLIFDEARYRRNSNLADLSPELRRNVLAGVTLYRAALLASRRAIASTPELAQAMREAGIEDVAVVENALDAETLEAAAQIRANRTPHDGVLIAYGSGTKTHDADFRQAAPALRRLLAARPDIRLRIIGELTLPPELAPFADRIEHLPTVPYARYLALLGDADISIAPLEPSEFNDAKSNIKFLEAAILGLPSVCSPRAQFARVIAHGDNGLLADDDAAWFSALDALVSDAGQRARLGARALQDMLRRYAPEAIARDQVAPLLTPAAPRDPGRLRVLMANVFFAPRSYGGATIVVEELARRLHARPDTEIVIVTSLGTEPAHSAVSRTVQDGITVFALPTEAADVIAEFDDPRNEAAFGDILDAVQPDIVHLHSIQQLSAGLASACRTRGIPYIITLHDAWWLCARQFMVRGDGQYCFQKRIDLRVCEACVPGARHLAGRMTLLRDALDGAALLLSPSEAHRALYLAQGIAPARIVVAANGVRKPAAPPPRNPGRTLRFGYVGGEELVKGGHLVRQAFRTLRRTDWALTLVDATRNLGFASIDPADWAMPGTVTIVPAYSQDTMDDFFAGIDVLLFPSQWQESFGLTVREALARDVWVIATAGGGPAEAITDGVNGTIIPLDGKFVTLQHAITTLLDNPQRLAGYRNPDSHAIIGYDTQAAQLREVLAAVMQKARLGGTCRPPQTPRRDSASTTASS